MNKIQRSRPFLFVSFAQLLVTQCPFTVLTHDSSGSSRSLHRGDHRPSAARVHIGELRAIAHSPALPAYVSSTDASGAAPSQLTVIADPPACHIVSRRTAEQRTTTHNIEDGKGGLCGWMTLVGVGGPLVPGMRLGIRVRFANWDDDVAGCAGIIPCHRVCCALVGEEYAVCEGASQPSATAASHGTKRTKTRSYVFDSAYEMVEYGFTDSISMGLVLPLDCPVTVKTDLVEVAVMLKVEFTVDRMAIARNGSNVNREVGEAFEARGATSGNPNELGVIRLDLPCEVVHGGVELDDDPEEGRDEERRMSSISAMRQYWSEDKKSNDSGEDYFDASDIQNDLKMLSLRLIHQLD